MNPNVSQHYRSSTIGDINDSKYYATLARAWANEDEDVVVLDGEYSAKHYSIKARKEADSLRNFTAVAVSLPASQEAYAKWDKPSSTMTFGIPSGTDGVDGAIGPEGTSDNNLSDLGDAGDSVSIDISSGFIFTIVLTKPTTTITVNKTDSLTDRGTQFTLLLKQGTGSNKVVVQTSDGSPIRWPNNLQPHLSYEKGLTDMITLLTVDGGSSYFGFMSSSGYPE